MRAIPYLLFLLVGLTSIPLKGQSSSSGIIIDQFLMKIDLGEDSIHAVYGWIANNISYDFEAYRPWLYQEELQDRIDYVLDKKKGVCQHYADLLVESMRRLGFESHLIAGCSLLENEALEDGSLSHAWVAIKEQDIWSFYDPTWDTPLIRSSSQDPLSEFKFYALTASEMNQTHAPFLSFWADNEMTHDERDQAIKGYVSSTELERTSKLLGDLEGDSSPCGRSAYTYNRSLMDQLRLNGAIDSYNQLVLRFNGYYEDKQGSFKDPERSDQYLRDLISEVLKGSQEIRTVLDEPEMKRLAKRINNNIYEIFEPLEEQAFKEDQFIELYLSKGKVGRSMLLGNTN